MIKAKTRQFTSFSISRVDNESKKILRIRDRFMNAYRTRPKVQRIELSNFTSLSSGARISYIEATISYSF